jgi:flagellar motor switch protein FliM
MSDALSPDAIAQLFAAAEEGNLPEGSRAPERRAHSIRKINFARPMKLSLVEQRRFERAHASFCADASMRLSDELRSSVGLEVINSSQLNWQAALDDVPQPSILGVVECSDRRLAVPRGSDRRGASPGQNTMLICVEEALALRMIERLLGGSYTDTQVARELTEIDLTLIRVIVEGLLTTLSSVWRRLLGLSLGLVELTAQETSPELLPPDLPTLALTIEVRDKSASSTIVLLVPHTAIEAASKSLGNNSSNDAPDGRAPGDEGFEAIRSALGPVRVQVRVEAGSTGLTIGEILALGKGDVVRLGVAGSACIVAGQSPLHRVRPGLNGSRRAVQIIEAAGVARE